MPQSEIIKTDDDKQHAFGWAYKTHLPDGQLVIDKSGEFVDDPEELEKAAYKFVLGSRAGGAYHRRDDKGVIVKSRLIESIVFTPEKEALLGISKGTMPTGWWVGFAIEDDEIWKQVKDGTLTSFSIHGKGTKKAVN